MTVEERQIVALSRKVEAYDSIIRIQGEAIREVVKRIDAIEVSIDRHNKTCLRVEDQKELGETMVAIRAVMRGAQMQSGRVLNEWRENSNLTHPNQKRVL